MNPRHRCLSVRSKRLTTPPLCGDSLTCVRAAETVGPETRLESLPRKRRPLWRLMIVTTPLPCDESGGEYVDPSGDTPKMGTGVPRMGRRPPPNRDEGRDDVAHSCRAFCLPRADGPPAPPARPRSGRANMQESNMQGCR